jgi:MerR family redox-sensitive transcriptional activator SoxR
LGCRREVQQLVDSRWSAPLWRELAERKLGDLDRQIDKAQAARTAIEHALSCPKEQIIDYPNLWSVVGGLIEGLSLAEAHPDGIPTAAEPRG